MLSSFYRGDIMKKEYVFKGSNSGKAKIVLEDDKITIIRKGFVSFLRHGLKGEKTIMFNSISGMQYKPSGIAAGYLQLVVMGSQENKGGLYSALKDENTICFVGKKYNKQAEEIKQYIENHIANKEKNNSMEIIQEDKYDKLAKLKKLLDEGVLTQEEFELEKEKILK